MKKYFKIIVLILILSTSRIKGVKAESFYEDNWISGVYANLIEGDFSKPQQMRFIRRRSDNKASYCLTPRYLLYDDQIYTSYNIEDVSKFSKEKLDKINKIAYFGYGYKNHTSDNWYAITQIMIWKEMEPNMDIFFTDKYKGNRINKFESEMQEINNLIKENDKLPSLNIPNLIADNEYVFDDRNSAINNYKLNYADGVEVSKYNNSLTIKTNEKGTYWVQFTKDNNLYVDNPYVYTASKGQDIFVQGKIGGRSYTQYFNVLNNILEIKKHDIDTYDNISGAKYEVYDENYSYIGEIITDENGLGKIDHLDNKLYRIKEVEAPIGYLLDENYHSVYMDEEIKQIELYNEKIKANIILNKYISSDSILKPEKDAIFDIYDINDNLVSSITTDNNGLASTILPYGKYRIHQVSSKEGFKKIDDFYVEVLNTDDMVYYVKDEKIVDENNNIIDIIEKETKEETPKDKEQPLQEFNKVQDPLLTKLKINNNNLNESIENPQTSDINIYVYIIVGYLSFIGLLYLMASIKNNK